jgi:hypothetical protein
MGKKSNTSSVPSPPPNNASPPIVGGEQATSYGIFSYLHDHVMYLNQSKFFAGVVMIMLNIGSKFISIQFSKSAEQYFKLSVTKQILVFAMAWMGTRDIYTALVITAVFVVLSDHLFNEESKFCIVPHKYRLLDKALDTTGDGFVSEEEIKNAERILEKAKQDKKVKAQRQALYDFELEKDNMNNIDDK